MAGDGGRRHGADTQRRAPRPLTLTEDIIKAIHPGPVAADAGVMRLLEEEEIRAHHRACLTDHPHGDDLWIFGYGSLMWFPEVEVAETRLARLPGWQRRFCLWQWRYRGTRQRPGLMLAIEPGEAVEGLALRIAAPAAAEKVWPLWKRELGGDGYRSRWVRLESADGPIRAVTFVVNEASERYTGPLALETAAEHIAAACGESGPSAEYLMRTAAACETLGIDDPMVWRLQELVAERLGAHAAGSGPPEACK